ncbi:MAG TPA: choice-of-anchor P family protein, partial [Acidimicrobiales bacterium]
MLLLLPAIPAEAATARFTYTGNAYGTFVKVGNVVKSGQSALVTLGCTREAGIHKSNSVLSVNADGLARTGTVVTTADTSANNGTVESKTTAETQAVNLLNGSVTADLVRAVSSTSHDANGFHFSAEGSTLAKLRVLGLPIDVTPGPNTKIDLPGIGYVVLNEQIKTVHAKKAVFTVNMIHVHVNQANVLGFALGTDIIVSHAQSDLEGPTTAVLDGFAYGSKVRVGNLVTSGPSWPVYMPCSGTNGKVKENTAVGVNIPGIATSGTVRNTAQGTVGTTTATGETTSTVEQLNLLNGLVTATVIKADAHASSDGTTNTFSDAGSQFVGLSVAGHPEITANVGANTKITIDGITLYLHR